MQQTFDGAAFGPPQPDQPTDAFESDRSPRLVPSGAAAMSPEEYLTIAQKEEEKP